MTTAAFLWAALLVAQEFVIRDRGGDTATVTDNKLDVSVTSNGENLASESTLAAIETALGDAVTAAENIETAVEDTTARDVLVKAHATGGCTSSGVIHAANDDNVVIKAGAGTLYALNGFSLDATPVYIKLYNDVTANIDENDTPVQRFMIPANSTAALGAGAALPIPAVGIEFSTGITMRVVTGIADNSTGAVSASEVLVNWCAE